VRNYAATMEALSTLEFEALVEDAIASLPPQLARFMSNVGVVVDEQAPPWQPVLGLYQGIPLTRRTTSYSGTLPDKITIFRQPIERVYGLDPERLRAGVRHVVVHEIAHHFGISDERLRELGVY
jgi:predicted Zn-dependent protease with MMP-like domain